MIRLGIAVFRHFGDCYAHKHFYKTDGNTTSRGILPRGSFRGASHNFNAASCTCGGGDFGDMRGNSHRGMDTRFNQYRSDGYCFHQESVVMPVVIDVRDLHAEFLAGIVVPVAASTHIGDMGNHLGK